MIIPLLVVERWIQLGRGDSTEFSSNLHLLSNLLWSPCRMFTIGGWVGWGGDFFIYCKLVFVDLYIFVVHWFEDTISKWNFCVEVCSILTSFFPEESLGFLCKKKIGSFSCCVGIQCEGCCRCMSSYACWCRGCGTGLTGMTKTTSLFVVKKIYWTIEG